MPERIAKAVKQAGLTSENLVLEVTESGLMEDVRTSLNILSRLTIKGYKLSIDDFGTGYSSLQQLLRIPFAELKLDRSFVDGAAGHRIQRVILESTVDLARRLDLNTVAEGVETSQDIQMVADCGVPLIQGYFIQKPLPMADLRDWLQ
jgi:EAL domain-containing protein (putative c-di-GMP-specific phosphodiesterase class I)